MLSEEMDYISRKLRLFEGPEGITLELVEWVDVAARQLADPRDHVVATKKSSPLEGRKPSSRFAK